MHMNDYFEVDTSLLQQDASLLAEKAESIR